MYQVAYACTFCVVAAKIRIMGKVFTAGEIAAGEIPAEGAHLEAAEYIVDKLFYGQAAFSDDPWAFFEPKINSGMVHGSVTHGTESVRSDLDLVLIYYPDRSEVLDTVQGVFTDITDKFKVPIEANIVTLTDALSKNHRIDPLFLRYLHQAQENQQFSWQWPADCLSIGFTQHDFHPIALARTVQRYIGAKSSSFSKALVLEDLRDEHAMQRALELPKNLGRKVLGMADSDFDVRTATTADVHKGISEFIADRSFGHEDNYGKDTKETLLRLSDRDAEYNEVLQAAINGELSPENYQRWLDKNRREVIRLAISACYDFQDSILRRYMREVKSDDWPTEKAEHEEFIRALNNGEITYDSGY